MSEKDLNEGGPKSGFQSLGIKPGNPPESRLAKGFDTGLYSTPDSSVRFDRRPLSEPSVRHSWRRGVACCGSLQLIVRSEGQGSTPGGHHLPLRVAASVPAHRTCSAPLCVLAARAAQRSCSSGHKLCAPAGTPLSPGARCRPPAPHALHIPFTTDTSRRRVHRGPGVRVRAHRRHHSR